VTKEATISSKRENVENFKMEEYVARMVDMKMETKILIEMLNKITLSCAPGCEGNIKTDLK
jgi:hypothetical protein